MLLLISLIIIIYMFTSSAIRANKRPFPWILLGFAIWIGLSVLFLLVTGVYIFLVASISNIAAIDKSELILQVIAAIIIIAVGFIVKEKIIKN